MFCMSNRYVAIQRRWEKNTFNVSEGLILTSTCATILMKKWVTYIILEFRFWDCRLLVVCT